MKHARFILLTILLLAVLGELWHIIIHADTDIALASVPVEKVTIAPLGLAHATSPQLLFVGDIMLGRNVETLMNQNGLDYPFLRIGSFLQSEPMVIANFEGTIVIPHVQTPDMGFQFSFDPDVLPLFPRYHIGIVSLANNHSYDYGVTGFEQTEHFLDSAGIAHAGNPFSLDPQYVLRKEIGGRMFLFVSFNATNPDFDYSAATKLVTGLRSEYPTDFMVALVHGGQEYSLTETPTIQQFAHTLAAAGLDLYIGAHPHVVEPVELVDHTPIFYSLGNFIFDQYFSTSVQDELGVELTLGSSSEAVKLVPFGSSKSQPGLMAPAAAGSFLSDLASRSQGSLHNEIIQGTIVVK